MTRLAAAATLVALFSSCSSCPPAKPAKAAGPAPAAATNQLAKPGLFETKIIAQDAYVYGFPMIANYKAMFQFAIDPDSGQFKAPFNRLWNDSHVATPKDTAVVTPNSDTPYSLLELDLRAEPIVLSVPEVEAGRYYSVQLIDMYTFNYGYIGSRATGNGAGSCLVAGPGWQGETPAGVKRVFRCATDFSLAIYRTQLFRPDDIVNVKKIQAGYRVQTLSEFLKKPAPPPPHPLAWPTFSGNSFKEDCFATLNFLLRFCPVEPEDAQLRAQFAEIGVAPGKPFEFEKLDLERKIGVGLGIRDGYDDIEKERLNLGDKVNGWNLGVGGGNRAYYRGDNLERAAVALAGLYANDAAEALYPIAYTDGEGRKLDAHHHRYTLTFPEGQLPPVNAFWSVTLYDGKTQLLIENPIHRYLINSPMLPDLKTNADGGLTIYIQKDSPGADDEANWLPAPDGDFYLVMRLYWPKEAALQGDWEPPPVERAK